MTETPADHKTEAVINSTPLLVRARSFKLVLNWNVSLCRHQCTPNARSTGSMAEFDCKSRSLIALAHSEFGMADRTLSSLLRSLWSLKFSFEHISKASLTMATVFTTESNERKPSSMYESLVINWAAFMLCTSLLSCCSVAIVLKPCAAHAGEKVAPNRWDVMQYSAICNIVVSLNHKNLR